MSIFIYYVSQKKLQIISSSGSYSIRATSGKGACMNLSSCQNQKDIGPIPKGQYYMLKKDLTNPNFIKDIARNIKGDWGDWRIPIHATGQTKVYGRNGFFMHGGTWDGSAGCIDVGGSVFGNETSDKVLKSITSSSERIQLWVY